MASPEDCSITTGSIADSYVQPLFVRFMPPAFIQRRALVLATLRSMAPSCGSLLDVGTGSGGLLSYLTRCDDDVPISRLVGIDPDQKEITEAVENTKPSKDTFTDRRWRPLTISLLKGGVRDITDGEGVYDMVTAIEVLEHLDPPDVYALCKVCLGQLRPVYCIVTTPNRDFNHIFDRIDDTGQAYTREGVPYKMRHEDHRFEMSRTEFEAFCDEQCSRYGYSVQYTGVGSVSNAFHGQANWRATFPEDDIDTTFGYSTQAAIFKRLTPLEDSDPPTTAETPGEKVATESTLQHVATHEFPWSSEDHYPPSPDHTAKLIVKFESIFRPPFVRERDFAGQEEFVAVIDCKDFYEDCYEMRRASRFDFEVYLESLMSLMDRKLVPAAEGSNVLDATATHSGDWQYFDANEPQAKFESAKVIRVDQWRTCIRYKYDISSFSSLDNQTSDEDSLSTISGDWNMPPEAEVQPEGDWFVDWRTNAGRG